MNLLPNLETLTRQVRAAADNLTAAEGKTEGCMITLGKLLNLGRPIWGWPEAGTAHGGSAGPWATVVEGLTFQQWCVSSTGRSWGTCTNYMSLAAHPEMKAKWYKRIAKGHSIGRNAARAGKLGIPVVDVPPYLPRDPEELERMARRYRIDNAVACMLALKPDEYDEAQARIAAEKVKVAA